jgi:hypothetical protein
MPSFNHRSRDPGASARKAQPARRAGDMPYLSLLLAFEPFGQLDTKIARAKAQDEPVLYAHILPGLDALLCRVRGAHPPYPVAREVRASCIEAIADALEQPFDGLDNGGFWYEGNGFGFLVFTSRTRERVLAEFGALNERARTGNAG